MAKVAIIYFPGSTGISSVQRALTAVGLAHERVLWNTTDSLNSYDAFILPAGCSYGNRIRPGVVAAHTAMMRQLKQAAGHGKPILGIGNGCQILIEAGVLPGVEPAVLAGATTMNVRKQAQDIIGVEFYHSKVYVKHVVADRRTVFTNGLPIGTVLPARVADTAGCFTFPEELALELERNQQIVLKYCTAEGAVLNDFPTNPNGAMWGIAGLCNPAGNVVGYIPELERDDQGTVMFAGLQRSLTRPFVPSGKPLQWQPGTATVKRYHPSVESLNIYVESAQTICAARMAEALLRQRDFHVNVQCKRYWEIWHDVDKQQLEVITKALVASSVLLNDAIDQYTVQLAPAGEAVRILVRDMNDYKGKYAIQQLRQKNSTLEINNIIQGTLWEVSFSEVVTEDRMNLIGQILQTYVFYNPYAQECYIV